jgi:hypothetical protein
MRRKYTLTPEQLRIMKTLDVDTALKNVAKRGFIPDNREIALAGIHKARLKARGAFTRVELDESRCWLREHGYKS